MGNVLSAVVVLGLFFVAGCKRVEKQEPAAPMAIMFVIDGRATYIGNEDYEPDPNAQYQGLLHNFEAGFDKVDLARRVPPGTRVGIVTYAEQPIVRLPLSPVVEVHGSSFGTQLDYKGRGGSNNIHEGIEAGLAELTRARARTKLLIVIGSAIPDDGSDVTAATRRLTEIKTRAASMHIAVEFIFTRSSDPGGGDFLIQARSVNSIDGVIQELERLVSEYGHATPT